MDLELKGSRVLVVGGTGGIGSKVVSTFDREGATTVIASSNPTETQLQNVEASPVVRIDLRESVSIGEGMASAVKHLRSIDVLVVAASVNNFASFWDLDRKAWREQFEVKYLGIAELCKEAVQYMEPGGVIVLLSGIAAGVPFSANPAGGAVNAALEHFVKLLAIELAAIPVRVVGVSPGFTRTSRFESFSRVQLEKLESEVPLARVAEPEDIADVVVFLASARSSYITGTTVVVDGGRTVTGATWPTTKSFLGAINDD